MSSTGRARKLEEHLCPVWTKHAGKLSSLTVQPVVPEAEAIDAIVELSARAEQDFLLFHGEGKFTAGEDLTWLGEVLTPAGASHSVIRWSVEGPGWQVDVPPDIDGREFSSIQDSGIDKTSTSCPICGSPTCPGGT